MLQNKLLVYVARFTETKKTKHKALNILVRYVFVRVSDLLMCISQFFLSFLRKGNSISFDAH